jgi:hypothetical protein
MINSTFNNQSKILETHFKNDVYLNDVLDYILSTMENTTYPRTLKILTDAQEVKFKFTVSDLKAISNESNKSLKHYDTIIDAIVINSPEAAAITTLYQAISKNESYHFEVFSTKEAALNWLRTF